MSHICMYIPGCITSVCLSVCSCSSASVRIYYMYAMQWNNSLVSLQTRACQTTWRTNTPKGYTRTSTQICTHTATHQVSSRKIKATKRKSARAHHTKTDTINRVLIITVTDCSALHRRRRRSGTSRREHRSSQHACRICMALRVHPTFVQVGKRHNYTNSDRRK